MWGICGYILAWARNCLSTASTTRIGIRKLTWLDSSSMSGEKTVAVRTSEVIRFANFEKV